MHGLFSKVMGVQIFNFFLPFFANFDKAAKLSDVMLIILIELLIISDERVVESDISYSHDFILLTHIQQHPYQN